MSTAAARRQTGMPVAASALADWQRAVQAGVLAGDPRVLADIDATAAATAAIARRLDVYAEGYRLRLIDVLGEDFPLLRARRGEAGFTALATGYVATTRSRTPSLRDYGDRFAGWLAAHDEADARADAALAAFEWARNAVFDAADTPVLAADAWRAVSADAWATLTLRPIAAVRLLDLPGRVLDDADAPAAAGTRAWLLWRESRQVRWRVIDADEARALHDVIAGEAGLATLCAAAAPDDADAMACAVGWLKRWLHDGLIAAFAS